ncbi:MAG: sensor histidine kinase [Christensenellales bacterium]
MKKNTQPGLTATAVVHFTIYLACMILFGTLLYINMKTTSAFAISYGLTVLLLTTGLIFSLKKRLFDHIIEIDRAVRLLNSSGSDPDLNAMGSLPLLLAQVSEVMEQRYTAEILKKEAELNELQSQINPHFLYNTLESIRGQALEDGAMDIANMTEALASFFRYSIRDKSDIVTLRDEIENVRTYFMVQQYRFNDRFQLNIHCRDESLYECNLPKLVLQPIVENCIHHGLETKVEDGHIDIHIESTRKRLLIDITDDGVGMSEERLYALNRELEHHKGQPARLTQDMEAHTGNTGIALINVNERIKLKFGEHYGIFVSSVPMQGTNVQIVLPMVKGEQYET